jgi:hypothetical protein
MAYRRSVISLSCLPYTTIEIRGTEIMRTGIALAALCRPHPLPIDNVRVLIDRRAR